MSYSSYSDSQQENRHCPLFGQVPSFACSLPSRGLRFLISPFLGQPRGGKRKGPGEALRDQAFSVQLIIPPNAPPRKDAKRTVPACGRQAWRIAKDWIFTLTSRG